MSYKAELDNLHYAARTLSLMIVRGMLLKRLRDVDYEATSSFGLTGADRVVEFRDRRSTI
jgi:hypothetical protein